MQPVTRPPVSTFPERAFFTLLAIWIIDSFFMRAPDYFVRHDDGLDIVLRQELQYLIEYTFIHPYIAI